MTEPIEIPFPLRGRSKELAPGDQVPLTTSEIVNMRGRDSRTGEVRGAQRSGLTRHVTDDITTLTTIPVRRAEQVVFDSSSLTFEDLLQAPGVDWARNVPADARTRRAVTDRNGDLIALSGDRQVVKYNQDGVVVWTFTPTLPALEGELLALAVDDSDNVYVATFTSQGNAGRIYAYRPSEVTAGEMEEFWTQDTTGHTSDLWVVGGRLYAVINDADARVSTVAAYDSIQTFPVEVWARAVPFEANQVRTTPSGSVIVNILPGTRTDVSAESFCGTKTVQFQPTEDQQTPTQTVLDIEAGSQGLSWARFDASGEAFEGFAEGNAITYWPDDLLAQRDLILGDGSRSESVSFVEAGLCGKPAVRFDGNGWLEAIQDTRNPESVDSKAWVPFFDNQPFMVAMLVRVANATQAMGLFDTPGKDTRLVLNLNDGTNGVVSYRVIGPSRLPSDSPGTQVQLLTGEAEYDASTRLALIVASWAGDDFDSGETLGAYPGHTGGGFVRVNGDHAGSFVNVRDRGTGPAYLGRSTSGAAGEPANFQGEVLEVLTFYKQDRDEHLTNAEKLEGYLAHRWGVQTILPAGHPHKVLPPNGTGPGAETEPELRQLYRNTSGLLLAIDPADGTVIHGMAGAGIGYGLAVDSGGNILSTGMATVALVLHYTFTDCLNVAPTLYTTDDRSAELGQVVTLDGLSQSWRVGSVQIDPASITPVNGLTVTSVQPTCPYVAPISTGGFAFPTPVNGLLL